MEILYQKFINVGLLFNNLMTIILSNYFKNSKENNYSLIDHK